jgi:hypothetical protein
MSRSVGFLFTDVGRGFKLFADIYYFDIVLDRIELKAPDTL